MNNTQVESENRLKKEEKKKKGDSRGMNKERGDGTPDISKISARTAHALIAIHRNPAARKQSSLEEYGQRDQLQLHARVLVQGIAAQLQRAQRRRAVAQRLGIHRGNPIAVASQGAEGGKLQGGAGQLGELAVGEVEELEARQPRHLRGQIAEGIVAEMELAECTEAKEARIERAQRIERHVGDGDRVCVGPEDEEDGVGDGDELALREVQLAALLGICAALRHASNIVCHT